MASEDVGAVASALEVLFGDGASSMGVREALTTLNRFVEAYLRSVDTLLNPEELVQTVLFEITRERVGKREDEPRAQGNDLSMRFLFWLRRTVVDSMKFRSQELRLSASADKDARSPEALVDEKLMTQVVAELLALRPEQEQRVISLMLDGGSPSEVARETSVPYARIARIWTRFREEALADPRLFAHADEPATLDEAWNAAAQKWDECLSELEDLKGALRSLAAAFERRAI